MKGHNKGYHHKEKLVSSKTSVCRYNATRKDPSTWRGGQGEGPKVGKCGREFICG